MKKDILLSPSRLTSKFKNKNKLSLIEEANLYLLRRVNDCTPYYNVNKWEKDYEKSQYYKMNHCQLPVIDFKRYKKQDNKPNKRKIIYKNIYDNNSINSSLLLNSTLFSNNNNTDYISLNFFLNNKSFKEHSYIIITSLNELFSSVIQKLFNTIPFLKKKNIIGYTLHDNDNTTLLDLNKTVKDNGLTDGSKIIIQLK